MDHIDNINSITTNMETLALQNPFDLSNFNEISDHTDPEKYNMNTDVDDYNLEEHLLSIFKKIKIDSNGEGENDSEYNINDDEAYTKSLIYLIESIKNQYASPYGVANVYSNGCDDEDFIYKLFTLSKKLNLFIMYVLYNNAYCSNIFSKIDFTDLTVDYNSIYYKILYIYKYVTNYYIELNTLQPEDRIKHIPDNFLDCVENTVSILYYAINNQIDTIYNQISGKINISMLNVSKYDKFQSARQQYLDELIYGLNLILMHIDLKFDNYKQSNTSFHSLKSDEIEYLFQILNNLCVVILKIKFEY